MRYESEILLKEKHDANEMSEAKICETDGPTHAHGPIVLRTYYTHNLQAAKGIFCF